MSKLTAAFTGRPPTAARADAAAAASKERLSIRHSPGRAFATSASTLEPPAADATGRPPRARWTAAPPRRMGRLEENAIVGDHMSRKCE
jgi:hypothetical protein